MIIRGRACVIKTAKDYLKVKDGDILFAENAKPDIVLVIGKVRAIVVEVDNKLCHAAIIAREYGKPIIMGIKKAVTEFKDGDLVEVNFTNRKIFKI